MSEEYFPWRAVIYWLTRANGKDYFHRVVSFYPIDYYHFIVFENP